VRIGRIFNGIFKAARSLISDHCDFFISVKKKKKKKKKKIKIILYFNVFIGFVIL